MSKITRALKSSDRHLGAAGFVMGALALFVAVGGDALAAKVFEKLKPNTVTSKVIVDNTIKSKDLAKSVRKNLGKAGPQGEQGPAGPATEATVADGSITTAKLADQAVTSIKVLDSALTAADLANNSVGAVELITDSVGTNEVDNESLVALDLATSSVAAAEIAADAVGASEVDNESLQALDLAASSVNESELSSGAVNSAEVANGSLTGDDVGSTSGIVSLNFPQIADNDCETLLFNAPQSVDGDAIVVTPEATFAPFFEIYAEPNGGSEIRVQACNRFGADGNPGVADFAFIAFDAG